MESQEYSYNIVWTDGDPVSVTVFDRTTSESHVATSAHPEFNPILLAIRFGEPIAAIRDLFDKARAIDAKFKRLSERVAVRAGNIYFDGVQVHGALVETIIRAHESGTDDFMALVNFMEKIETNPNEHSKEHLFRWLNLMGFSITPDGDIIAYKGIREDDNSVTAGTAIVDGELITGFIPNKTGSIVEMPRNEVTFDPENGCSTGLHAATFSFARSFGNKVVALKVNPRDVVSVPIDSGDQKMRVCRYYVLQTVSAPIGDIVLGRDTIADLGFEWGDDLDDLLGHDDEELDDWSDGLAYVTDSGLQVAASGAEPAPEVVPPQDLSEPLVAHEGMLIDGQARVAAATALADAIPDYTEFRKPDFEGMTHQDMRKLAKQWKLSPGINPTKAVLVSALSAESRRLRKNRTRPRKA